MRDEILREKRCQTMEGAFERAGFFIFIFIYLFIFFLSPASVMYGKTPSKSRQLQEKIDKVIAEAKVSFSLTASPLFFIFIFIFFFRAIMLCITLRQLKLCCAKMMKKKGILVKTSWRIERWTPSIPLSLIVSTLPTLSPHLLNLPLIPALHFLFPPTFPKLLPLLLRPPPLLLFVPSPILSTSKNLLDTLFSLLFLDLMAQSQAHFPKTHERGRGRQQKRFLGLSGRRGGGGCWLAISTKNLLFLPISQRQHNLNTDLLQSKLNASKGSNKKKASSSPSKRRIRDNQELSHQSLRLENAIYHHEKQHCLSLCEHSFPLWLTSLILGRNLLLYGFGSKKLLIEQFLNDGITQNFPCLVVNGYHKAFSLKALLDSITADLLGYFGVTFSTPLVQCEFVAEYFDACYPTKTSSPSYQQLSAHLKPEERTKIRAPEHVFIAIHNIERVGPHATHNILSLLASVPQVSSPLSFPPPLSSLTSLSIDPCHCLCRPYFYST